MKGSSKVKKEAGKWQLEGEVPLSFPAVLALFLGANLDDSLTEPWRHHWDKARSPVWSDFTKSTRSLFTKYTSLSYLSLQFQMS